MNCCSPWECPVDCKAFRLKECFSLYLSLFLSIFFSCQCCEIIAKTSKMFGQVASASFAEQPPKLEISVNLRLLKSSHCGARYKESWVKTPVCACNFIPKEHCSLLPALSSSMWERWLPSLQMGKQHTPSSAPAWFAGASHVSVD